MVVESAVPRMVHFCASPGMPRRWSLSLERSVFANGDLHLSSGFALQCFPRSYTRLLWFVVFCFGPWAAVPPKLSLRDSSAAVAATLGFVPHGQWALLDADMLALIDWSARPVEPIFPPSKSRLPIVSLRGSFLTVRVTTFPRETPS